MVASRGRSRPTALSDCCCHQTAARLRRSTGTASTYLYPVDGTSQPRPIPGYMDGDVLLQWSADGRFLFIREAGNLALRIHRLDLETW